MVATPSVGLRPAHSAGLRSCTHPCGPASTSYSHSGRCPAPSASRVGFATSFGPFHHDGPALSTSACSNALAGTSALRTGRWGQAAKARLTACAATASASAPPPAPPPPPPTAAPEAWSVDTIRSLGQGSEDEEEEVLGQKWRSNFADDPTLLYDYTEEAHDSWNRQLEGVLKLSHKERADTGAVQRLTQFPAAMATEMIGMGTWRLKGAVDGLIELMVARIEGSWRELLDEDLTLYPTKTWKARGWDFIDSLDPTNEWDQFAHVDVPNPEEGDEGYPRLLLENRIYCSRVFRKLHLEVVWQQDGLEVLHVVMYPRYEYDLPILALDVVVREGAVTMVIIDACPVRPGQQLPPHYTQTMQQLQKVYLPNLPRQRKIPDWGKKIFSQMVVCFAPETPEDLAGFFKYAIALHRAHLQLSHLVQPVDILNRRSLARREEILQGQRNFVERQLENKLTRRVLDRAFGEPWSEEYMRTVLFDFNPKDDPAWVNGELNKFYDYFDSFPEVGTAGDEIRSVRSRLDTEKADGIFEQIMTGDADVVSRPQVEWALQHRFKADPDFRTSIQSLVPDAEALWQAGQLGKLLAAQLPDLGETREAWTRDEEEVTMAAMEGDEDDV